MKWIVLCILTALMVAPAASAADVTGKWVSEMKTPDGQTRTSTFDLKQDGEKLTGTVSGGRGGAAEITDGKVDGDKVSFTVARKMQDREFKMQYKGTVSGSEMKLNVGMGERSFDIVAKKQ